MPLRNWYWWREKNTTLLNCHRTIVSTEEVAEAQRAEEAESVENVEHGGVEAGSDERDKDSQSDKEDSASESNGDTADDGNNTDKSTQMHHKETLG